MFTKSHQGVVKNTVVLEFENGYSITLTAGVEMCMYLVMDEKQIKNICSCENPTAFIDHSEWIECQECHGVYATVHHGN